MLFKRYQRHLTGSFGLVTQHPLPMTRLALWKTSHRVCFVVWVCFLFCFWFFLFCLWGLGIIYSLQLEMGQCSTRGVEDKERLFLVLKTRRTEMGLPSSSCVYQFIQQQVQTCETTWWKLWRCGTEKNWGLPPIFSILHFFLVCNFYNLKASRCSLAGTSTMLLCSFKSLCQDKKAQVHSGVSSATRRKATGADQKKKAQDGSLRTLLIWTELEPFL